jgi:hypothetical protein
MPAKPIDIVGKRFGRLVVLAYAERSFWRCQCDCGHDAIVKTDALNSGKTQSCGCLQPFVTRARSFRHGHAARGKRSKAHGLWADMIQRCTNPNVAKYPIYGGRGIRVCERWREFANFLADMGEPPPGLTLDRIDTNGNYEPGNCRWLDQRGQQNNRRNNRLLTFNGKTLGITEWSRRSGVYRHTIRRRLERGWPIERALIP